MLEVVVHNAPEKNAKRANNPHEFVQTTELVAPLPQNAPKSPSWCENCTKTLLYQNMRYNSKKGAVKKQPKNPRFTVKSVPRMLFLFGLSQNEENQSKI